MSIRKKKQAEIDKNKLRREVRGFRIKEFKGTLDEKYADQFNRLVCAKLDQLEAEGVEFPSNQNRLAYAEAIVRKELEEEIDSEAIIRFLIQKLTSQKIRRLQNLTQEGLKRLSDPEKALIFTAIMFEVELRKTDNIWQQKKFKDTITAGINGEPINLISVLCCINQYDYKGGYAVVPGLYAYRQNLKLEPIPLIVDELVAVRQFFEFYSIETDLTIYVSDTEYTEVDKFGPVNPEILKALQKYVSNLETYTSERDQKTQVASISVLTNSPLYKEVKSRVLRQVTNWKDPDFTREWYRKFERYSEEMCERVAKRKIFPSSEIRQKSLNITRRRWAVNAAEGAVFGSLGPNTILVSTEDRKKDRNYVIDKSARSNFLPVIYALKAAEEWNRKLIKKDNQIK